MIASRYTYRENVEDVWEESEFVEQEVPVPGGSVRLRLAKRETRISAAKDSIPFAEVRLPTASWHQTEKSHNGAAAGKPRHRQPHVRQMA